MPGPTPHYPPEFEREAVKVYRSSGKSIPKMAEELGIASESLRRWISQHEIDAGEREGLTTEEREELSRLRREARLLKQERDFLKKAAVDSTGERNGLCQCSSRGAVASALSFVLHIHEVSRGSFPEVWAHEERPRGGPFPIYALLGSGPKA